MIQGEEREREREVGRRTEQRRKDDLNGEELKHVGGEIEGGGVGGE